MSRPYSDAMVDYVKRSDKKLHEFLDRLKQYETALLYYACGTEDEGAYAREVLGITREDALKRTR